MRVHSLAQCSKLACHKCGQNARSSGLHCQRMDGPADLPQGLELPCWAPARSSSPRSHAPLAKQDHESSLRSMSSCSQTASALAPLPHPESRSFTKCAIGLSHHSSPKRCQMVKNVADKVASDDQHEANPFFSSLRWSVEALFNNAKLLKDIHVSLEAPPRWHLQSEVPSVLLGIS